MYTQSNPRQRQQPVQIPLRNQTAKSPPMTAPPGIAPIGLANAHGFQFDVPSSSAAGTNPVIISDPVSGAPILVSKADQRLTAAPMNPGREFRLGAGEAALMIRIQKTVMTNSQGN